MCRTASSPRQVLDERSHVKPTRTFDLEPKLVVGKGVGRVMAASRDVGRVGCSIGHANITLATAFVVVIVTCAAAGTIVSSAATNRICTNPSDPFGITNKTCIE
jgi:hypothetical protein